MRKCAGDEIYRGKCCRGRNVVVLDCRTCGYAHLHPKPSERVLREYYRKQYFTTEKPDYAKKSGTESPYQREVDAEKIQFAQCCVKKPLRVLDFGCGPTASFLNHIAQLATVGVLEMEGYEPSNKHSHLVQNIGNEPVFIQNKLEHISIIPNLIHMGFVLEHTHDPVAVLRQAHSILVSGGHIIVEVPSDFSMAQKSACLETSIEPGWWVSSPDHVNYFNSLSLHRILNKAGFVGVGVRSTFPVELALLLGVDYTKSKKSAKVIRDRREEFQKLWALSGASHQVFLGRTIWCVARKEK